MPGLVLTVSHLNKSYQGFKAVDNISFEVYPGEIFGFLGPNGAGKTTSIKMICGLLKPDSGSIVFQNGDSFRKIGFCPQNIVIWDNLTCLEQLAFMGEMYKTKAAKKKGMELLEIFGLMDKKNKLAKTLSGGMQRRLNIALALVHEPEFLVLDEPQAGLDPQSRILVRDFIQSAKNKTTILLTTHDMEEAEKLSDRVCIIDHGKIIAMGTVEDIKKSIGRGDMLEIEIDGDAENLISFLKDRIGEIKITDKNKLQCIAENAQDRINEMMQAVKKSGARLLHFSLRKTSLEDVFIRLTGRELRE